MQRLLLSVLLRGPRDKGQSLADLIRGDRFQRRLNARLAPLFPTRFSRSGVLTSLRGAARPSVGAWLLTP